VFTGIVEEVGTVAATRPTLTVEATLVTQDCAPGASLSVDGVCLTVVERTAPGNGERALLAFDLSPETHARTTLGKLVPGDHVNLERPVAVGQRLGGHLVQGHVDGVGVVEDVEDAELGRTIVVRLPDGLDRYVVEKGSISVDGISLTVTGVEDGRFGVALVPHTLGHTTLSEAGPGDEVNVEVDVVARYVERLLGGPR